MGTKFDKAAADRLPVTNAAADSPSICRPVAPSEVLMHKTESAAASPLCRMESELIEEDIILWDELDDAERFYPIWKPSCGALFTEMDRRIKERFGT